MVFKKTGKKYASLFYLWQKKPKTKKEDLQKRLNQLKYIRNTLVILVIIFLIATIITTNWIGIILIVIFLIILAVIRKEKNKIESMLKKRK